MAPALATRKVPGSTSSLRARPSRCRNASRSPRTWPPTSRRSTLGSSGMRPTLNPPPRFTTATSGNLATMSRVMRATRFQTSGSVPEPMCVCRRVMRSPWRAATVTTSSRYSCQMPKLDEAHQDLLAGRDLPELLQLMERARVEENAAADVLGEPARGHLGGELDASRGESGLERPLHLEVARRVH